VLKITIILN